MRSDGFVDRNRLWTRLNNAVDALPAPLPTPAFVVDLDDVCRGDGLLFDALARFGRLAMNQIAPFLVDGEDGPALTLNGVRYPVRMLTLASPFEGEDPSPSLLPRHGGEGI